MLSNDSVCYAPLAMFMPASRTRRGVCVCISREQWLSCSACVHKTDTHMYVVAVMTDEGTLADK